MYTRPSISGASAELRAIAPSSIHLVHQHGDGLADLALEAGRADLLLQQHQAREAFLLHFGRHVIGQGVGRRAFHRRVGERADAIQLRLFQEIQQFLEFFFGLAGKADDEGAAQRQVRDRSRAIV